MDMTVSYIWKLMTRSNYGGGKIMDVVELLSW
jgi:hypothetical protein